MNYGNVVSVSEVLKVEAEEIALRRRRAGLMRGEDAPMPLPSGNGHAAAPEQATPQPTERLAAANGTSNGNGHGPHPAAGPIREPLPAPLDGDAAPPNAVGLALSGGGIRSGSVCLGFIQSLYRRSILRHVDYLSTVSGGGYAGAFFSSLILDCRFPRVNWKPGTTNATNKTLDILPDASGRQPKSLAPMFYGGERLNDPLPFASRWFLGALLLNLCIFSGLIAAAALLAWVYRLVDLQGPRLFLKELGVVSDRARSFFLPMLGLFLWLLAVGLSQYSRRIARLQTPLFAIFCATLAMGVCSYLTTADLSSPTVEKSMQAPSEWRERLGSWTDQAVTFLLVALGGALLPYLNPKGLLRSGEEPRNAIEKWTFAIASRAFLYGVPLFLFAYFARENISDYSAQRQSREGLHHLHLEKFNTFWDRVWREHQSGLQPGHYIWSQVASQDLPKLPAAAGAATSFETGPLANIIDRYSYFKNVDASARTNLLKIGRAFLPWTWPAILEGYAARKQSLEAQGAVADALNGVLATPELTERFAPRLLWYPRVALHNDSARIEALLSAAREIPPPREATGEVAQGLSEEERRRREEWRKLNWGLLQAHYGPVVRSPDTVFAAVVGAQDQWYRLTVCGWAVGVFLLTGLLIDLNAASLHGYYRQKLGEIWINEMPKWGYRIPIRELSTTHKGGPYHLINGALNLMGRGSYSTRSETARFTFSHRYCGSARTDYARTDFYDGGKVDLADAIGISAAAVNPASVRNPLVRALLLVLNFRLGQWVPNPARRSMGTWWATPIRLFFNWIRFGDPEDRAYCFVTDGGHDENTAIGALLERRCRVIIAVDASQDAQYQFVDFLKLVRVATAQHGVQIVDLQEKTSALSFAELTPDKEALIAKAHFLVARIIYPPRSDAAPSAGSQDGYLILAKPNLTNDEPTELLHYRTENPLFPHDPTLDQFYDARRFASYRQLGDHMGEKLCDRFFSQEEPGLWLAEKWTPPGMAAASEPTSQLDESTWKELLDALRKDDRSRAEAVEKLHELYDLRANCVEVLVDEFWKAHRIGDTATREDVCKRIEQFGMDLPGARKFLSGIAKGRVKSRTDPPLPLEIQELARQLLQPANRGRRSPARE